MFFKNAPGMLQDVTIRWNHVISYILDVSPFTPLAWLLTVLGSNTLHLITCIEPENIKITRRTYFGCAAYRASSRIPDDRLFGAVRVVGK